MRGVRSIGLGAVPAANVSSTQIAVHDGYVNSTSGIFWARGRCIAAGGVRYDTGDVITVRLDLNENTVAIRKNGSCTVSPQRIAPTVGGYYFAFNAYREGSAVTIVGIEEAE